MIKRIATLALFISIAASAFALDGTWTANLESDRDHLHLNITTDRSNLGTSMSIASFGTLTPSQINAAAATPVTFELRRDAGTIAFEGTFRDGKGAGRFTFTPDRTYFDKVRTLGIEPSRTGDERLFVLALHDVSTTYIKAMQDAGYKTTLEKYLAMRVLGITPEYAREMESLTR